MMLASNVLYDAGREDSPYLPFLALFLAVCVGVVALRIALRTKPLSTSDERVPGVEAVLAVVLALAFVAKSMPNLMFDVRAHEALKPGGASVVQGCVGRFNRIVHHNEHDVADTYFSVADHDFHFFSSMWSPGFHDGNDSIQPKDRLRILMARGDVVRIERMTNPCP